MSDDPTKLPNDGDLGTLLEEARPKLKRPRLTLVATYAQLGRAEESKREVEKLLADHPDASIEQERQSKFASDEARDHWIYALRKAGLPE